MQTPLLGERTRRRLAFLINFTFWGLWILLLFAAGRMLIQTLLPFLLAFGVATALQRPVSLIQKRCRCSPAVTSTAVCIVALLVIGSGIFYGLWRGALWLLQFIRSEETLVVLQQWGETIARAVREWSHNITTILPPAAGDTIAAAIQKIVNIAAETIAAFSGNIVALTAQILPRFLLACVFFTLSLLFFTRDYDTVTAFLYRQIPPPQRASVKAAAQVLKDTCYSLVKVYCILGTITFALLLIGFFLLRISHPLLLALIISLVDALPILGVGAVLLPWAGIYLLIGNTPAAIGLLILYGIVTLTRNLLQPRIVSRKIGLPPLITLAAMYLGWRLSGFGGLITVPIIATVLLELQRQGHLYIFKENSR